MFTKDNGTLIILVAIFGLAVVIRFLFFPGNIYFGFDQARDAYTVRQILDGDLKLVGPPTQTAGLFHGVLYYYLFLPFYYLGQGDPQFPSAFLRVINAAAVFLVFGIGQSLFNKRVGLLAALIFAVSFEQSQYALFLNHPSLAVISVLMFYLGLAGLFFKKDPRGWIVVMIGLGLSLQFEFSSVYLGAIFLIMLVVFGRARSIYRSKKMLLAGLLGFVVTIFSFILAELKFNFPTIHAAGGLIKGGQADYWHNISYVANRYVRDNLISLDGWSGAVLILVVVGAIYLMIKNENLRSRLGFLLIWFGGGLLPYVNNQASLPLYYYAAGASVSLVILVSFFISSVVWKMWLVGVLLVVVVMLSNLLVIFEKNPKGSIPEINVQSGMLLSDEKKVLDTVYSRALMREFAVNAMTMPYKINTTWSYLFEWYGHKIYGYMPVWGQEVAAGYPGGMRVVGDHSRLPQIRFTIIEPSRGINPKLIDDFLTEEGYFTKVQDEFRVGEFIVQQRVRY